MQTISADQFKQKYGQTGIDTFGKQDSPYTSQQDYFSRVTDRISSDLNNRIDSYDAIQKRTDTSLPEKALQTFGQGAGLAANTVETAVSEVPGVKQALQAYGTGINWLAENNMSPIKHLGDIIGSNKTLQAATQLYDTDKSFKDTVDAVANTVRLGTDVQAIIGSANFATNVTNKIITKVKTLPDNVPSLSGGSGGINQGISEKATNVSSDIMNRVARLKPTDFNEFKRISDKTPGEYLAQTGNFGTPEQIIQNESVKFVNSMKAVDSELEKLPGLYKDGAISDALDGLLEKAKSVSSKNVKANYQAQIESLIAKHNTTGLSMSDINTVKRLYERNVKLGYKGVGAQMNPSAVEQATNIDSAVRNFQMKTAVKLGFKNLDAMNKQTQISKFIINKLGSQIVGQSGLNAASLTDWIVLSGGNAQSVAALLTKKVFSSKAVQAKLAELLNQGPALTPVKPNIQPTSENLIRQAFPGGAPLELPPGGSGADVTNNVPIVTPPPNTMEAAAPQIFNESMMTSKPELQQSLETKPNPSIDSNTISPEIHPSVGDSTIPKELQPLAEEARKYKSAEEYMNSQASRDFWEKVNASKKTPVAGKSNNLYHSTSPDNLQSIIDGGLKPGQKKRFEVSSSDKISFAANEQTASYYGKSGDIMLRTKTGYKPKDIGLDLLAGGEGTYTTTSSIPPSQIQIKLGNKWHDITSLSKSQLTDLWKAANKK